MTNLTNRALSAYSNVDLVSAVNSASPLQLILLLYDGAIGSLAAAKGHMLDMKFAEKGRLAAALLARPPTPAEAAAPLDQGVL